jgi:hypothetical protein
VAWRDVNTPHDFIVEGTFSPDVSDITCCDPWFTRSISLRWLSLPTLQPLLLAAQVETVLLAGSRWLVLADQIETL